MPIGQKSLFIPGCEQGAIIKLVCLSACLSVCLCLCVTFVVFTDCESCTTAISTNPGSAFVFVFFSSSLLFSSSTRRRFYPQRSSGQAVVTGVVPSPPRYVPSFLSRIGSSIPLLVDFHRKLLTHVLALSANQCLCKKKSPINTSMCTR